MSPSRPNWKTKTKKTVTTTQPLETKGGKLARSSLGPALSSPVKPSFGWQRRQAQPFAKLARILNFPARRCLA